MALLTWQRSGTFFLGLSLSVATAGCTGDGTARSAGPNDGPATTNGVGDPHAATLVLDANPEGVNDLHPQGDDLIPAANRPMVLSNPHQLGDLYWSGQLDDSKGYRWDVGFIPGMAPIARDVAKSYARSGGYIADFGKTPEGDDDFVGECLHFTTRDCIGTFMIRGIGGDISRTSHEIHQLATHKPFTWYAIVVYDAALGYVIKPVGRAVLGTVGAVTGFACTAVVGSVEGIGRTGEAVGDATVLGTAYPLLLFAWQQPAYLFSIFNAEPDLTQNGHYSLNIVGYHDPVTHMTLPIPPLKPAPVKQE